MHFIDEFKKGQLGGNKGLYMGPGLSKIFNAINGIQKGRIFGIAAPPKAGKSTFVNYAFLIQPYLYSLEKDIPVEWIYYSLEIDRISMEFDVATYFLFHDYNITQISLEPGILKEGKTTISLSADYLRGRVLDDKSELIKVKDSIKEVLKVVYENRIIPIFGEHNSHGLQIKPGVITFIETKDNPTGIYKYLMTHASKQGTFIKSNEGQFSRIVSYKPDNPDKYIIVITDHLRKMVFERGWQMKQTVDKMIEYQVELRNLLQYTFVDIIHTNRDMMDPKRLAQAGDMLYPTSDDIKDTGNLAEDCDYVFTLMNPNDDRYNLKKHFGEVIKDPSGNELYPNLRTVHLVESRHCNYPQHFKTNMIGSYKNFE